MTKLELQSQLENWYNTNSTVPYLPDNNLEAQQLCIIEIFNNECMGINRSFYQYVLDANLSRDSLPKSLIYSSIDLLEIDSSGDIVNVTPVYYEIVT